MCHCFPPHLSKWHVLKKRGKKIPTTRTITVILLCFEAPSDASANASKRTPRWRRIIARKDRSSREGYSGEKEDVFQRTMRCKNNSKFSKTERRRESTRLALKSDSLFRRQQLLCISFGRDYAAMSPIEAYHQLSYSLDAIVGIETLQPAIPLGSIYFTGSGFYSFIPKLMKILPFLFFNLLIAS